LFWIFVDSPKSAQRTTAFLATFFEKEQYWRMMRHAAAMLCRSSLVSLVSEGPPWESTNPAASGNSFTLVDVGDLG
jgi:hypothetical protein